MTRKFFLFAFATFLLFLPFFTLAQELEYPQIPGVTAPQPGIPLEEFARYLYRFSLIIGAVIAFAVFIYGGFVYLTSVGNPSKMKDGKERMLSATLGLLILFGSYIILTTLDPNLVVFQAGDIAIPAPPESEEVEIEPQMPKSCQEVTDFQRYSVDLADFLGLGNVTLRMLAFTDSPWGAANFLKLLEKVKDIDCSFGQTHCRPDTDSTDCLAIDCQWKNNPQKRVLNKIKETEKGLNDIKKLLKELLQSIEAKRVKGVLNQLEDCSLDVATNLYIRSQAQEHGILAEFNFGGTNPFDFYCCERVAFPAPRAESPCELVPVGRVPKRLLEIYDELIFLTGFMIDKYSKLMNYGSNMAHLLSQCDIKECETGDCSGSILGLGLTCPAGDECTAPAGDDDICENGVLDELEQEYEKAKKVVEELSTVAGVGVGLGGKILTLQLELNSLKSTLHSSANQLNGRDPDTEHLFSCFEAKSLGLSEDLSILGIGLGQRKIQCKNIKEPVTGILLTRRHGLDYYICPKP